MKKIFAMFFISILLPSIVYAGSGCCSWHGGQSYCDKETGRWVCQDGTYSPTCKCLTSNIKEKNEKVTSNDKNLNVNTILSIFVMIVSYYIMQKLRIKKKNKLISKSCAILFYILSITFGWLVIPLILGLYGYFVLEIISIFIICIITEYSDN